MPALPDQTNPPLARADSPAHAPRFRRSESCAPVFGGAQMITSTGTAV